MTEPLLLYGATDFGGAHFSADILWRTDFRVTDPIFLLEQSGKATLFVSSLEYGRAKRESKADHLVLLKGSALEGMAAFLKKRGGRRIHIPPDFPHAFARTLEKELTLLIDSDAAYPRRFIKSKQEIFEMARAAQATDAAIDDARSFLAECKVRGALLWHSSAMTRHSRGRVTSEFLRARIERFLFERGYLALGTIVACGVQAADPHCVGAGPLKANEPIVIDVFPVSKESHYYADCTRTFFKGEPSLAMKKIYSAVLGVQEEALAMVRAGVDASTIYDSVVAQFEDAGYPTHISERGSHGFIHGVGHGVGLEIHEPPRIRERSEILKKGNIVTIEPGLYYPKAVGRIPVGGIRIEDMVVVEKISCRNLTKLPKSIDWAIVP